ncbi:hypothetical protein ACQKP0_08625 [Heyndrickxia sp. NPDC080065]|uniref:hypothetical protein n=1 Tax=Heyndrickxia sp. NPDC080065 TaxID=3390568 RepID=UPI003D01AC03
MDLNKISIYYQTALDKKKLAEESEQDVLKKEEENQLILNALKRIEIKLDVLLRMNSKNY